MAALGAKCLCCAILASSMALGQETSQHGIDASCGSALLQQGAHASWRHEADQTEAAKAQFTDRIASVVQENSFGGGPFVPSPLERFSVPQGAGLSKDDLYSFLQGPKPGHICVTGNRAVSVVRDEILPPGKDLEDFELKSKLNPTNQCRAWQHAAGNSLFTIGSSIEDRCAARWKVQLLSCDILVHAQEGPDCNELFKLRLIVDQPTVPMFLLHSDNRLASCYEQRLSASHLPENTVSLLSLAIPQFHFASLRKDDGGASHLRAALKAAVQGTKAQAVKHEIALFGHASRLRQHLVARASPPASAADLMVEFLKDAHGFPADASALQVTKRLLAKSHLNETGLRPRLDEEVQAVVVDCDSGFCNAGFAGDPRPRAVFPSIVGRVRHKRVTTIPYHTMDHQDLYVGDDAQNRSRTLDFSYPLLSGIVSNWDDMQRIWHYTYNELRVAPERQPVLLTEGPLNPRENRKKMTQIMFETFKTPAMYVAKRATLSLLASGRSTGIVLDSGEGVTYAVPIHEGYPLPHATLLLNLGGRDLSDYMAHLLGSRNFKDEVRDLEVRSIPEWLLNDNEILRDLKDKMCYVAADFDEDLKEASSGQRASYELPGGNAIVMGYERFQCPEVLFKPSLIGKEDEGIQTLIFDAIMRCDGSIRKELFGNIVLSGSNTMLPGIDARIASEIAARARAMPIKVVAPRERGWSAWAGASRFAFMPLMKPKWISKNEYSRWGSEIVNRKCQ